MMTFPTNYIKIFRLVCVWVGEFLKGRGFTKNTPKPLPFSP